MHRPLLLGLLLVGGCRTGKGEGEGGLDTGGLSDPADADGDGYDADEDCDDNNSLVHPGSVELCDGFDNDCDGTLDEGVATDFYADSDGDGFGDPAAPTEACEQPEGYVPIGNDCDDTAADAFPGAAERCDDRDNDCDGAIDEDVQSAWYADADGDGYGDPGAVLGDCDPPSGYTADASDCDDTRAEVSPDGSEVCNHLDDDCDGSTDEEVTETWYVDLDGDGYGVADSTTEDCAPPTGYAATPGDCDDLDAEVSPAGAEVCNAVDDDCDGTTDEDDASDAATFYADADADGYGDAGSATRACSVPSGYTVDDADCDDTDAGISPAEAEVCNSVDDDCNGLTDEDDPGLADAEVFYEDADLDGYGDAGSAAWACEAPGSHVEDDGDCDDTDGDVHPSAAEACNGADDDCDGGADEGVEGSGEDCAAEDCLAILTADSSAADGDYWIDFDGVATETACDMTTDGGGWTLIFADDFEGVPDSGWSLPTTYACGGWSTLLGGYGVIAGGELDIAVSTYAIAHAEAWVELEYVALDSWDGETAYVEVDGGVVWSRSQNNHSSSYSEVCGWNRGTNGSYDSMHAVSTIVGHAAGSVELLAGSTLDQASTDESFGVDDVRVWIR